jgi:hypothetical protein
LRTPPSPIFLLLGRVPDTAASTCSTPALGVFEPYGGDACMVRGTGADPGLGLFPEGEDHIRAWLGLDQLRSLTFGRSSQAIAQDFTHVLEHFLEETAPPDTDYDDLYGCLPLPQDVWQEAVMVRTRDALIWTKDVSLGLVPPVDMARHTTAPVFPVEGIGGLLLGALDRAGHTPPPDGALGPLLDTCLIGLCPAPHTAHGTIALHQRLTADCVLLTELWRDLGTEPRPIVPVFL